jgi:hypothetical protein
VRETLDVSAAPTCFSKVVAIVVIVVYFPADISFFLVSNNTYSCIFYFLQKFPNGKSFFTFSKQTFDFISMINFCDVIVVLFMLCYCVCFCVVSQNRRFADSRF